MRKKTLSLIISQLMVKSFFLFFVFCSSFKLIAQPNLGEVQANDTCYNELLKALNFNDGENTLAMPILYLDVPYTLNLEFDMIEGTPRRLYYTLRYFEKNWQESPVDMLEVMDGLNEFEINQFQTSFNTYSEYVHYIISLSPRQLGIKQTGNFLILVYDQDLNLYATRKFFVARSVFSASLKFVQPVDYSKINTHQSLNLIVNTASINVLNPKDEIQVEIYQNGNPQTKLVVHEPLFFSGNSLRYTKDDEIIFPGGKEFRGANVRSILNRGLNVKYWDQKGSEFYCYLKPDEFRRFKNYIYLPDYNGKLVYTSPDVPISNVRTQSEYFYLNFKLAAKEKLDHDVYVYGLLSDWKLRNDLKMKYDETEKVYTASIFTKNAYIDYAYATVDENNQGILSEVDGNWSETENDYFVLVYYRPYGGRFDQLFMARKFNSNSQ
ncbi:MAG: type IX secretion system plug protein domain-containing protein [Saprospiraceae bacterium]